MTVLVRSSRLARRRFTSPWTIRRRQASSSHDPHHAEPVNESFGRGFYIALAAIPVSLAIYKFTHASEDGSALFTRMLRRYSDYKEQWTARNDLHTKMIEQAAFDRNLFQSSKGSRRVELRFPEIFNTGSPYNVPAGQGGANLDKLVAHYKKEDTDAEERRAKKAAAKKD